jgi:hypothetical protein
MSTMWLIFTHEPDILIENSPHDTSDNVFQFYDVASLVSIPREILNIKLIKYFNSKFPTWYKWQFFQIFDVASLVTIPRGI